MLRGGRQFREASKNRREILSPRRILLLLTSQEDLKVKGMSKYALERTVGEILGLV